MAKDRIEKTLLNLERHGFKTKYFSAKEEALDWLLDQVEAGKTATSGGSVTLGQIGLAEKLKEKGVNYLDRRNPPQGKTIQDVERMAFAMDYYFSSANAITEDGYILNVDAHGNRVAAIIYGPENVYIVAGQNKICKDTDAAFKRNQEIAAPLNSKRLNRGTPCMKTGACADCLSPGRICRAYTLLKMAPDCHSITVVIIGEDLGY